MNNLDSSFERAKEINKQQEEMLKHEVHKEQNIVNTMIQEIMSGTSPSIVKFDARKDFDITDQDAELLYSQSLKHIEENTKWYKR